MELFFYCQPVKIIKKTPDLFILYKTFSYGFLKIFSLLVPVNQEKNTTALVAVY